ncbi:MAG: hypothetical protein IH987_21075 [Planctomycetes bacterium]|nr:hypothetical protein [Planctomycetota bacterium]
MLLAGLLYQTAGWHYLRGYNEVGNFLVVPVALAQAGLNLLVAVLVAVIGRFGRWRRARGGRWALAGLLLSALMAALSPLYARSVGKFAARQLWPADYADTLANPKRTEILTAMGMPDWGEPVTLEYGREIAHRIPDLQPSGPHGVREHHSESRRDRAR